MNDPITHYIVLLISFGVWLYGSFPLLRYTILTAEGKFQPKLILWFVVMIAAIFFIKHALYSISGWPAPGTWSARLFFGMGLFLAVPIPFIREYFIHFRDKFRRNKQ